MCYAQRVRKVQVAVFLGVVGLLIGYLSVRERDPSTRLTAAPAASASASASALASASAAPESSATAAPDASAAPDEDAGAPDPMADSSAEPVGSAELPSLTDAPKSVHFGVVLVKYAGAQLAPEGTRSKEEAAKLAEELAAEAQTDFEAAVAKGDKGSTADAGRMYRGLLNEQDADYALFSLDKGGVSKPVDTPRGFWILKRLD